MTIRADMYSDERMEQRAQLDKLRMRLNEKEVDEKFMSQRGSRISPKTLALQKEFAAKADVAGRAVPSFSINASIPGRAELEGGFSKPEGASRLGTGALAQLIKKVGFLSAIKEAVDIYQALTVDARYAYLPKLQSAIREQLYPGEAVRVFTFANAPNGISVSIESIHAPSLTHVDKGIEPPAWSVGELPYLKNPPNSFNVERSIQSGPMRPLHEFPTEHTVEQYRRMSDRMSARFPDIR